jgi:hypothetical protein
MVYVTVVARSTVWKLLPLSVPQNRNKKYVFRGTLGTLALFRPIECIVDLGLHRRCSEWVTGWWRKHCDSILYSVKSFSLAWVGQIFSGAHTTSYLMNVVKPFPHWQSGQWVLLTTDFNLVVKLSENGTTQPLPFCYNSMNKDIFFYSVHYDILKPW